MKRASEEIKWVIAVICQARFCQPEADVFISAVDLCRFRHLIVDLDPEEEAVFSRLTESVLTTTLYRGKTTEHEHTVEFWFGKMG